MGRTTRIGNRHRSICPRAADPKRLHVGQAATVAGYAGPGFHNWPGSADVLVGEYETDDSYSKKRLINRRHPLIYRRDWREEHLLALRLALKGWQHLRAQINELDTEIARRVRALDEHAAGAQTQREAPAPGSVCVRAPK